MTLRRIIEDYGDSTRFILACNTINKVIEPLQSRCCVITLQPPTSDDIVARLGQICEKAGVRSNKECLRLIADVSDGDVRNAVNNLQTVAVALNHELTVQGIKETLDFISVDQIGKILKQSRQSVQGGWEILQSMIREGYSVEEIVNAFYRFGLDVQNEMNDIARAKYLKIVAQTHARVANGINNNV